MPINQYCNLKAKLDSLGVTYQSLLLDDGGHAFDYWNQVRAGVYTFLAAHL